MFTHDWFSALAFYCKDSHVIKSDIYSPLCPHLNLLIWRIYPLSEDSNIPWQTQPQMMEAFQTQAIHSP